MIAFASGSGVAAPHPVASAPSSVIEGQRAQSFAAAPATEPPRRHVAMNCAALLASAGVASLAASSRARLPRRLRRLARPASMGSSKAISANPPAPGAVAMGATRADTATATVSVGQEQVIGEAIGDVANAGNDTATPHWSDSPMKQVTKGIPIEKLDWPNLHGLSCGASGFLFAAELVRFVAGLPPSDFECYFAAVVYAIIYATRFEAIRGLPSHFRVTFYATTGWTIYYIAHLLAATNPALFAGSVYSTGIVFLASTIYFYKHWLERMWRHYVEDRFRAYYLPGLLGLMYFHGLDIIDMFNQWLDPHYWNHIVLTFPDQAWTIKDVRLTGLFMSSMALFMITLHNKGVLTGGRNTLITVLFTIFVPAFFLTVTHATLQASFP